MRKKVSINLRITTERALAQGLSPTVGRTVTCRMKQLLKIYCRGRFAYVVATPQAAALINSTFSSFLSALTHGT